MSTLLTQAGAHREAPLQFRQARTLPPKWQWISLMPDKLQLVVAPRQTKVYRTLFNETDSLRAQVVTLTLIGAPAMLLPRESHGNKSSK